MQSAKHFLFSKRIRSRNSSIRIIHHNLLHIICFLIRIDYFKISEIITGNSNTTTNIISFITSKCIINKITLININCSSWNITFTSSVDSTTISICTIHNEIIISNVNFTIMIYKCINYTTNTSVLIRIPSTILIIRYMRITKSSIISKVTI